MELRTPSPLAQVPELQDTKGKRSGSPLAKGKDLQDTTGKMPPPPPIEDLHLCPSTKQSELLPSTDRAPPTHSRFMRLLRIVRLVTFLFPGRKFRTSIRTLIDKCSKLLNHSERRLW
jgi:hypothetical protein